MLISTTPPVRRALAAFAIGSSFLFPAATTDAAPAAKQIDPFGTLNQMCLSGRIWHQNLETGGMSFSPGTPEECSCFIAALQQPGSQLNAHGAEIAIAFENEQYDDWVRHIKHYTGGVEDRYGSVAFDYVFKIVSNAESGCQVGKVQDKADSIAAERKRSADFQKQIDGVSK